MVTYTVRIDSHVCNFDIRVHIRVTMLVQVFVLYIVYI